MDHSLTALIAAGPADSSVLQIFRRVLKAIEAIHASGASHPPLSPETIQVNSSGEPQIQVLDRPHGIADTVAFGSAKYSAPEAFLGISGSSSCEIADCYVLGLIFYEILIGRSLFVAQFASLENGPPSLWLEWHADKTAKARPLAQLRPNLGHFAHLIDGMIDKDPGKRIGDVSRILSQFSTVEDHTVYRVGAGKQSTTTRKAPRFAALLRKKVALTAARFSDLLASPRKSLAFRKLVPALRKPPVAVGLGVLIALGFVIPALIVHREHPSRHARQPVAAAPSLVQPSKDLIKQTAPLPPPSIPGVQGQPALSPESVSDLQVESHLPSVASLLLDNLERTAVPPGALFTANIRPGLHRLILGTRAKSFMNLSINVGVDGEISLTEIPEVKSLHYAMLASNGRWAKLFALPNASAGFPGQPHESVPQDGRVVANGKVIIVDFGQEPKSEVRLDPLSARSIRIIVEPGYRRSLPIPVEISSNVLDADIVINGAKQTYRLNGGVRVIRLRAGEYRIKLVHADYQDSAGQDLVIDENDHRQHLHFALSPILRQSTLTVSSVAEGIEILIDGTSVGVTHANTVFKARVSPGRHTVIFRRTDFEDLTATREFPDGSAVNIGAEGMRPFGKVAFHVLPSSAQISCRREGNSQAQDCSNNQTCPLRAGAYDVTVKAAGFESKVDRILVGAGEEKPLEWKLTAVPPALSPANFFENGQSWTVEPSGWWTKTEPGYSFMRATRGTFVFDILKPRGLFARKTISIVVNYEDESNRVLYTIDRHSLHRSERAPGFQDDHSVAHEIPDAANYRLTLELLSDRVIIRNVAGKTLDNLSLANSARGKVGFSGKLKLRILQASYPQNSGQ